MPHALLTEIAETMGRYGRLQLVADPAHGLVLHAADAPVLEEVMRSRRTPARGSWSRSPPRTSFCFGGSF